ncbi:MAG TPA: PDZ domain-containing protein [Bacillota bacterium]|nr:PDZ domain-containing protein [Bacillota bacterium]
MGEAWGVEVLQAIAKIVLQPLFYWSLILVFYAGYRRIKKERKQFGIKVNDLFSEWSSTWILSIGFGLIITAIMLGVGVVFTYETMLVLSISTILLSIHGKLTWLSASYTVGLTYIVVLFAPILLAYQDVIPVHSFDNVNLTSIALLASLLLIAEGILLRMMHGNESFASIGKSTRGARIGEHSLSKLSIIPFFVLIPSGLITPIADFWPTISIGAENYSLLLFPFILGFNHVVRSSLPQEGARYIGKWIGLLGTLILAIVIGSIYVPFLSALAILVAIIGREFILYKFRSREKQSLPFFTERKDGIMVLTVIPGSRADRLGIVVGETIVKVNGKNIQSVSDFYYFLQESNGFFKLDVLDKYGEVRFIQSALYEGDHHELGIIFIEEREPYTEAYE